MKFSTICSITAAGCLFAFCSTADADIINYYVEFDQSGNVALGSTLDWKLYAEVTGEDLSPGDDDNFGIETAAIDLENNTGESMMQGTIAAPFADYDFRFTGNPTTPGRLTDISASLNNGYDAGKVEAANPGNGATLPAILLATGSYQVNTLGTHTLETILFPSAAFSEYYIEDIPGQFPYAATNNFMVTFGPAASVEVVSAAASVPEPGSMLLLSTFVIPAVVAGRRRRRKSLAQAA